MLNTCSNRVWREGWVVINPQPLSLFHRCLNIYIVVLHCQISGHVSHVMTLPFYLRYKLNAIYTGFVLYFKDSGMIYLFAIYKINVSKEIAIICLRRQSNVSRYWTKISYSPCNIIRHIDVNNGRTYYNWLFSVNCTFKYIHSRLKIGLLLNIPFI